MSTDSTTADRRFYLSYPSTSSFQREIFETFCDYLKHAAAAASMPSYKAFHHIVQRAQLSETLTRWGVPMDDPSAALDYFEELQEQLSRPEGTTVHETQRTEGIAQEGENPTSVHKGT